MNPKPKLATGERPARQGRAGFTLIELLVVIAIIAVLAAILLPALAAAKANARRTACMNNLSQLAVSVCIYANDFDAYPPRVNSGNNPCWPAILFNSYRNTNILTCPTEIALYPNDPPRNTAKGSGYPDYQVDNAECSFIFNGWNDDFPQYWSGGSYSGSAPPSYFIKVNQVRHPSETVVIGERRHSDQNDYWADSLENENGGVNNMIFSVQHARHSSGLTPKLSGGSDFVYCDGGVRYRKFGQTVIGINEWITKDDLVRSLNSLTYNQLVNNIPPD